jgi:hypothetical protein
MAKKIIPALNKETISGLQEMRDLEVSLKKGIKKQEKRDNLLHNSLNTAIKDIDNYKEDFKIVKDIWQQKK